MCLINLFESKWIFVLNWKKFPQGVPEVSWRDGGTTHKHNASGHGYRWRAGIETERQALLAVGKESVACFNRFTFKEHIYALILVKNPCLLLRNDITKLTGLSTLIILQQNSQSNNGHLE